MTWLKNRLSEPSTWAGLAGLIPMAAGLIAGPVTPQAIGGLVAALAAVFMREKGNA